MSKSIYIAMRRDLNMGRGKEIAQAIHAFNALGRNKYDAVIVLKAVDDKHLFRLSAEAERLNIEHESITDAGHTVFKESTLTCAAFYCERDAFPELAECEAY